MQSRTSGDTALRLALTISILGLMAPTALAGTASSPEFTDPSGDAQVAGVTRDSADIVKGWIQEGDASLDFHIEVTASASLEQTLSQLEGGSWVISVVDPATDTKWEARAFWTGSEMSAEILRDGQAVSEADASAEVDGNRVTVSWENHNTFLAAGAVLTDTHGYTKASGLSENTACHGEQVLDCAPNTAFGRDFVLLGEKLSERVGDVTVTVDRAAKGAAPGDEVAFSLAFQNEGDQEATFTLETTAPETWEPAFDSASLDVPAGGDNATELRMTVPGDHVPGRVEFTARVRDEAGGSASFDLAVGVTGEGDEATVSIVAETPLATVRSGQSASFDLTVTNEGDLRQTVTLKVTSEQAAWASLSDRDLSLDPGESDPVILTVDVPSDADPAIYTHMVTVEGEAGPSDRASATFSTSVEAGALGGFLPAPGLPAVLAAVALGALSLAALRGRRRG